VGEWGDRGDRSWVAGGTIGRSERRVAVVAEGGESGECISKTEGEVCEGAAVVSVRLI
jgi:hypothetical protein